MDDANYYVDSVELKKVIDSGSFSMGDITEQLSPAGRLKFEQEYNGLEAAQNKRLNTLAKQYTDLAEKFGQGKFKAADYGKLLKQETNLQMFAYDLNLKQQISNAFYNALEYEEYYVLFADKLKWVNR